MTQRAYIQKTLRESWLADAYPVTIPMPKGLRLESSVQEEPKYSTTYKKIILEEKLEYPCQNVNV
jgi:hypothetical protein